MDVVAIAARRLAERRWGALIVLERDTGLNEYVETGVPIDGTISVELLLNVFFPNSCLEALVAENQYPYGHELRQMAARIEARHISHDFVCRVGRTRRHSSL